MTALANLALLGLPLLAAGPTPRDLRTLFPKVAEVEVTADGLSRLELPADLLAACRPDLSDVRLFDAEGKEVPYAVDGGGEEVVAAESAPAQVLGATRDRGYWPVGGTRYQESYDLALPPPSSHGWELFLSIASPDFVRTATLEAVSSEGAVTPLLKEVSLFRMPQLPEERTRLSLPSELPARASRLRLTLSGVGASWLAPAFSWQSIQRFQADRRARIPLKVLSSESRDGFTTLDLARPKGLLPDGLRIETTTGTFDRAVEVWDEGADAAGRLGSRRLFRIQTASPVEELEVPLVTPHGERLRLRIEDKDSPALSGIMVQAVLRKPWLVFSLPARPGSGTLAWGGGRAWRPAYDLSGLLPTSPGGSGFETGERARALAALYDPRTARLAHLGLARDNPLYDALPALAFAMTPGAPVDGRAYQKDRHLTIPSTTEGLSVLTLLPEDLAALREDLADLRVVDASSRQWPYLLQPGAETRAIPLAARVTARTEGRTTYALSLPVAPSLYDELTIDSPARFFDRAFEVNATSPGEKTPHRLASGRLVRREQDPRPVTIALPAAPLAALTLEVRDGDDAPLELSVTARAPLPALYLVAPAGDYRLLLAHPEEKPPLYELSQVREVVLAVQSEPIAAGPLEPNPDYRPGLRLTEGELPLHIAMWGVLLLAVLVLGALTVRLVRREEEPAPAQGRDR